jgi:hypothetical protein
MIPHIPGSSSPAADLYPVSPGSPPAADLHPPSRPSSPGDLYPVSPGQQAAAASGFDKLKRRVKACVAWCGAPGGTEAAPLRPRVQLPRLAERPAQPAPGLLRWPDGRSSTGQVVQAQEGPAFEVPSRKRDAVLAERGRGKPGRLPDSAPALLPVAAAPGDVHGRIFVPRLPQVLANEDFGADGSFKVNKDCHVLGQGASASECKRLNSIRPDALADIVLEAGTTGDKGLGSPHIVAMKQLFGRSLEAIAQQCTDPQAVRDAAQALQARDSALFLQPRVEPNREPAFEACASFDAREVRDRLAALSPGQTWHLRVFQAGHDASGHFLGITLRKQDDGNFRVGVVNSNGWFGHARHTAGDVPGQFKTMSPAETVAAMQDLVAGRMPPRPLDIPEWAWLSSAKGRPLLAWLEGAGQADLESGDFHGTGADLQSARQKAGNCTSESLFAFLATALPPADYKLAKAACLNTLVQVADRLEPPGSAAPDSPLQAARQRLQQRITSGLSGHMVAPRPGPGQADG